MDRVARRAVDLGEYRVWLQEAGPETAPVVVLLHGLASDGDTWDRALPLLAERGLRAVAVDLPGHGRSDKPAGRYLLDDFAAGLERLLGCLGVDRAVLCGHSLGGAIAVHYSHHHPGRTAGLVLVSAGGLGREVHPVLRAAAVPGAERLFGWAMRPRLQRLYGRLATSPLLGLSPDNLANLRRAQRALGDERGRAAFFASLRGVIAPAGQRGSFLEMDYLDEQVPTLLVWSEQDGVIPVAHARATRARLTGSKLIVFPGGGHEPHRRNATGFADAVADFVHPTVAAESGVEAGAEAAARTDDAAPPGSSRSSRGTAQEVGGPV